MVQNQNFKRRIEKIEKKLEGGKGVCFRFPCPDGSFIEVPGCRTLMDVLALAGIGNRDQIMDETERKRTILGESNVRKSETGN